MIEVISKNKKNKSFRCFTHEKQGNLKRDLGKASLETMFFLKIIQIQDPILLKYEGGMAIGGIGIVNTD